MRLPIQRRLPRPVVIAVLAVALSIGIVAGPATAAAPVYLNSDGNCINPPSSSRTVDLSNNEDPQVVIDYGRSRLTEGNVIWQLVNLDTGAVEFYGFGVSPLAEACLSGAYHVYWLYGRTPADPTEGFVFGTDLSQARYVLHLQDNTVDVSKNLRFSVVP